MTGSARYNAANPVRATTTATDLLQLVRCSQVLSDFSMETALHIQASHGRLNLLL